MPIPDKTIPLATMEKVQEKAAEPRQFGGWQDAYVRELERSCEMRRLLTRLSDFMRRCDPDKCRPGEKATDEEWVAFEGEINAAIGKTPEVAGAIERVAAAQSDDPMSADLTIPFACENVLLERTIRDIAAELGCEADNEAILQRIADHNRVIVAASSALRTYASGNFSSEPAESSLAAIDAMHVRTELDHG